MKARTLLFFITCLFLYSFTAAQKHPDTTMRSADLKEIKVVGRKNIIEIKKEKLIFRVNNTVNATGFNVFDLLKKLPGVVIDNKDNILLKGAGGVKLMIDNKLVQLSDRELTTLLKSMSSSQVENIEIISNPSARYDAAGGAGLININTRKFDKYGLNGNISSTFTYGLTPKYNNEAGLNYGNSKLKIFLNINAANEQYNRRRISDRLITHADKSTDYFSDDLTSDDKTAAYSLRTGLDYNINAKNILGAMFNGSINHDVSDAGTTTAIGTAPNAIDSFLFSGVHETMNSKNFSANLNYRYKDTLGTLLSSDIDFVKFIYDNNTLQPNTFYSTDKLKIRDEDIRNTSSSNINIFTVKVDFGKPLFKGEFEAGWKTSYVRASNDFGFYYLVNHQELMDTTQTNRFNYTENINAAYVNYSKTVRKISWQAGLRLEQTYSKGVLIPYHNTTTIENKRSYFNVFPSATFTYNLDQRNSFSLLYSRRIDRPNYQYLNPFEKRLTILVYDKGDPFLIPQYTDKISLLHIFNGFLTSSVNYSHVSDLLNQVIDTVQGSRIVYQRANLGTQRRLSFDISGSFPILSWWNAYNSFTFYHNHLKGEQKSGVVDITVTSYNFYSQQTFTLPAGIMLDISCMLIGPFNYGAFKDDAMWKVDIGMQKKILKNRGIIRLNALNIFNQMIIKSHLDFGGIQSQAVDRNENRLFKVSFEWNFGKQKTVARKRKTGAEDESKRAK